MTLPSDLPTIAETLDGAAREFSGYSVAWYHLATLHACASGYARVGEWDRAAETMRVITAELAKLTGRVNEFTAAHSDMLGQAAAACEQ